MDILTHIVSGMAVGTIVASTTHSGKTKIILASALAGALPDIDVISLWSGFDSKIGSLFGLQKGADIYSAKLWYSHHAFMHSILAGALFAFLFGIFGFIINKFRSLNTPLMVAFFLSFALHLLQDMPTPASTWGGVRLLFPNGDYYGGTGEIWWWNNYDIFLIALGVLIINTLAILLRNIIAYKSLNFTFAMFILGACLITYQIKTRPMSFAYSGHTKNYQTYEQKSKQVQRKILGKHLFYVMERFDNALPFYF